MAPDRGFYWSLTETDRKLTPHAKPHMGTFFSIPFLLFNLLVISLLTMKRSVPFWLTEWFMWRKAQRRKVKSNLPVAVDKDQVWEGGSAGLL